MHSLHHLALAVLGSILLLTAGCHRRLGTEYRSNPSTLAINIVGDGSVYPDAWIVVGNAAGNSISAVRRVTGEGLLDFGNLADDLISVSVVYRGSIGDVHVDSYLNVTGGNWTWVRGPTETIGQARVTLHFPPGWYDAYSMAIPFVRRTEGRVIGDSTTQWTETFDVQQLESGDRFSVYAAVWSWSGSVHRVGWLVDQPFERGQVNSYDVNVEQLIPMSTINSSRPVDHIWMNAYRSATCAEYSLTWPEGYNLPGWTAFDFPTPAFPAERLRMTIYGSEGNNGYHCEWSGPHVSTSPVVPTGITTADYDGAVPLINNIVASGQADAVTATYMFNYVSYYSSSWIIHAPPGTRSIAMPTLPDSILTVVQFDNRSLWSVVCSSKEYDTINGYEGYINLICRSGTETSCRYDMLYESRRLLQGSWEPPSR